MPVQANSPNDIARDLAAAYLKQAVKIPAAPLFHMGNIAAFESKSSFDLMQDTINYLTCKAKAKVQFSDTEKNFLTELYEAFWWGGRVMGMPEAAKLADHYVNGDGKSVSLDSKPYQTSVVVQDTIKAMKAYILESANRTITFSLLYQTIRNLDKVNILNH